MTTGNNKLLHILVIFIIILGMAASGVGLFFSSDGKVHDFVNQYGDAVKIYGQGLYARDSFFKAPIFRGTDFTVFFLVCPLLIITLLFDARKRTLKTRLFLTSVISSLTYYAASIAFGVTYNFMHLVYIAFFSSGLFGLIIAMSSIDYSDVEKSIHGKFPTPGVFVFLVLTGIALLVAWLPDILSALIAKRPLAMIENYTTEITYVIDMGIVAPTAFICLYLLKKRKGLGYILLDMLLTVCLIMGIMLPIQTVFQVQAGIELPIGAIITKIASFCALALFALYFKIRLFRNMVENKN